MLNFFIKIKKVLSYITAKLKPRRTTFITILISNKATSFRLALPLIKKLDKNYHTNQTNHVIKIR